MKAGTLNRLITIQQRQVGTDDAGQPLQMWQDASKVWANVSGATGIAAIKAAGDVQLSIKQYSFRIRYREGLDESMRVLLNGVPFDVKQVRMDFAGREWTDLVCEQGGNDG